MKSKTSLFNRTIILNLLKRYWVGYAAYFCALSVCIIIPLLNALPSQGRNFSLLPHYASLFRLLQEAIPFTTYINFFTCPIAAALLFSYLYNPRHTGMMASLPIKRETMFASVSAAAILGMLLCNLAVLGIALLAEIYYGQVYLPALGIILLISMGTVLAFFGIAAFCCMLTGNIFAGPAVYVIFNFLAIVVEAVVSAFLEMLVFGIPYFNSPKFAFLSPAFKLIDGVDFQYEQIRDEANKWVDYSWSIEGAELVAVYAAVGLVLLGLALLLYKHRRMETAGDTVAIEVLKPVFRVCCTVGAGLLFALLISNLLYDLRLSAQETAVFIAAMNIIGGTLGYFISQMLITKTISVFRRGWKAIGIYAVCVILVVSVIEADLFGYERHVPDASDVVSIKLNHPYGGNQIELTEEENIKTVVKLHKNIIANKSFHELRGDSDKAAAYIAGYDNPAAAFLKQAVNLTYTLRSGETLSRRYSISYGPEEILNGNSEIHLYENLLNTEEAILSAYTVDFPVTPDSLTYLWVEYVDKDSNENLHYSDFAPSERVKLYTDCILPDIMDGTLGTVNIIENKDYALSKYNCTIGLEFEEDTPDGMYQCKSLIIYLTKDASRTLAFLREHGIQPAIIYDSMIARDIEYNELGHYDLNNPDNNTMRTHPYAEITTEAYSVPKEDAMID